MTQNTQSTRELLENAVSSLQTKDALVAQLEDALRQREDELNGMQDERDGLRHKLADVTNRRRARGASNAPSDDEGDAPPRKKTAEDVNSDLHPPTRALGDAALQAGRKWAIVGAPWLPMEAADFFQLDLDPAYDVQHRFDSQTARVQGYLHDIQQMLPGHLTEQMKAAWFAKQFHHGMRQQTSNTVHRVRQQLAEVLLGDEARHMLNPGDRFREFCVRIGYRNSGNPPFYSALDCPILHSKYASDQEKKYDPSDAFMNIRLMLIFIGIIRGVVACRVAKQSNGMTVYLPRGEYMQSKHQLSHVTVGSIAIATIMARFVLSEDSELKPIGPQTSIKWQEDFDDYFKILHVGLVNRTPSVRRVFREWDRIVYGQAKSKYGGGGAMDGDERQKAVDAALGLMAEEEPEPESEGESEA